MNTFRRPCPGSSPAATSRSATTCERPRSCGRTSTAAGAADNALAFLEGRPLSYVAEPVSPLSFKHTDVELHSVGRPAGDGLEEKVLSDEGKYVYRSVLLENGALRGVQMIGSHENFWPLANASARPGRARRNDAERRV